MANYWKMRKEQLEVILDNPQTHGLNPENPNDRAELAKIEKIYRKRFGR